MKFTAQIIIEVEADSFAQAAEHEREINALFQGVKSRFEHSRLEIKQKRAQSIAVAARSRPSRPRQTGKLAVYSV